MGIATILNLLPIICDKYQEMQLISGLNEYFNFDHNFYLLDSSADTNRYINTTTGITPQSLYVFKNVNNDTGLDGDVKEITSKNAFLIVLPGSSQFDRNVNLFRRVKKMQRLQINVKIGVFFSQHSSMEDLRTFFEWCKENLIINIFAATYPSSEAIETSCPESSINIFKFDPFGKFEVINVTGGSVNYDGFFVSRKPSFHQHGLRFANNSDIDRHDTNLWIIVVSLMNATYVTVQFNATNGYRLTDGIDIFPILLAQRSVNKLRVYPMETLSIEIVVPKALPYPEFSAYLLNTTSGALIGCCLIAIVALISVLSILRYVNEKKLLLIQSVVDVFNLVMNDNGNINYQRLCRSEVFVIVPLTFVGMIFTNGMLSNLKSYLTRPMLQPQINTLDEIYAATSVLLFSQQGGKSHVADLTLKSDGLNWSNHRFVSDEKIYFDSVLTLNQDMTYISNSPLTKSILAAQNRLKIEAIHNPNIQISANHYGYHVPETFLYFERLNEIIDWLRSSGLYDLWSRQYYARADDRLVKEYKERFSNHNETKFNANIENFEFPTFLFYGWLAGLTALILEIIWKRFGLLWKKHILRSC